MEPKIGESLFPAEREQWNNAGLFVVDVKQEIKRKEKEIQQKETVGLLSIAHERTRESALLAEFFFAREKSTELL